MQKYSLLNVEKEHDQNSYVLPVVITYHQAINGIYHALGGYFGIFTETKDLKQVFLKELLVSFNTSKVICMKLVRAEVYQGRKEVLDCIGSGNSCCYLCLNMQLIRKFS